MNINDKLNAYINENLHNEGMFSFKKARYEFERTCSCSGDSLCDIKDESPAFSKEELSFGNIDYYINKNKNDNKFQKLLFSFIDRNDIKDSEVYNKVHIDRRLFSKIRSDDSYHPSKETVILLGLSLELTEEEIEELLESASYSLPKNNIYDLIIRFCFIEGIYALKEVNELLDSYNCKLFSY